MENDIETGVLQGSTRNPTKIMVLDSWCISGVGYLKETST